MRGRLWLEGCLGLEPRLAISKRRLAVSCIQVKPPCLGRVLHPGICLTTEGKSMKKTSFRVIAKCQVGTIQYVDMAVLWGSHDKLSIWISLL